MATPTQWTWVWVDSGNWRWTGRPGVLQSMGSQRVGHDWVIEQNWIKENQISEVKAFSAFLCMGRYKSLGLESIPLICISVLWGQYSVFSSCVSSGCILGDGYSSWLLGGLGSGQTIFLYFELSQGLLSGQPWCNAFMAANILCLLIRQAIFQFSLVFWPREWAESNGWQWNN